MKYPKQKKRLSVRKTLARSADLASKGTVGTGAKPDPCIGFLQGARNAFGLFLPLVNQDVSFLNRKIGSLKGNAQRRSLITDRVTGRPRSVLALAHPAVDDQEAEAGRFLV